MNNTLWTFGDSFTYGNGCLPNNIYTAQYKKSDKDKIWPEIVSTELNFQLKNIGMGMFSNDKIIDSIIENYEYINKNDIVIIGKTFYHRFDIPNFENNELITISPNPENFLSQNYTKSEIQSISYFSSIMDSNLFKKRQDIRFDFLEKLLIKKQVKKCIIWDVATTWDLYQTIRTETNNEIYDHHWSYKGHYDFSNYILNKLKSKLI
jgi:hypothetical protein